MLKIDGGAQLVLAFSDFSLFYFEIIKSASYKN